MAYQGPGGASEARFPTTHWSRVIAAGDPAHPEARAALAELCAVYWYPIYAYVRRKGHDHERALDLTQGYFARLLEKGVVAAADRRKGRLRNFLRTDCDFFLADRRDHDRAKKRGGAVAMVPIDADDAERRYRIEPLDVQTPELLFDRTWALALLDRVLDLLRQEYVTSGRADWFGELEVVVADGQNAPTYATIAARLGTTESAVQSAVLRLRRRVRELVRGQIAATLDDPSPEEVEAEIRALFTTLAR
jgi:RNA polymerase sigma-70 factor (ECF subfamily)